MKSASQMSLEIRRKKKEANKPETDDAVDLSGIPDDATDQLLRKQESLTTDLGLDHNKPKPEEAVNHQSLMADSHSRQHEAETEDQDMELEHYADGGAAGMGAIAGGEVPKHTELAKINGFSDGGEVNMKAKRMARARKMMGY